jgi:hypothetical protein
MSERRAGVFGYAVMLAVIAGMGANPARGEDMATAVKRPHRLLVSVAQGRGLSRETLDARFGGERTIGAATLGHRYGTDPAALGEKVQTLQTLDGHAVSIETGQSIPLPSQSVLGLGYGRALVLGQESQYRRVAAGFSVTPKLSGEFVVLDIASRFERPSREGEARIDEQSVGATLSAPLGEWVEIGGEAVAAERAESNANVYSTRSDAFKTFIKVEDLDAPARP